MEVHWKNTLKEHTLQVTSKAATRKGHTLSDKAKSATSLYTKQGHSPMWFSFAVATTQADGQEEKEACNSIIYGLVPELAIHASAAIYPNVTYI